MTVVMSLSEKLAFRVLLLVLVGMLSLGVSYGQKKRVVEPRLSDDKLTYRGVDVEKMDAKTRRLWTLMNTFDSDEKMGPLKANPSSATAFSISAVKLNVTVRRGSNKPIPLADISQVAKDDQIEVRFPESVEVKQRLYVGFFDAGIPPGKREEFVVEKKLDSPADYEVPFIVRVPRTGSLPVIILVPTNKGYQQDIYKLMTDDPYVIYNIGKLVVEVSKGKARLDTVLNTFDALYARIGNPANDVEFRSRLREILERSGFNVDDSEWNKLIQVTDRSKILETIRTKWLSSAQFVLGVRNLLGTCLQGGSCAQITDQMISIVAPWVPLSPVLVSALKFGIQALVKLLRKPPLVLLPSVFNRLGDAGGVEVFVDQIVRSRIQLPGTTDSNKQVVPGIPFSPLSNFEPVAGTERPNLRCLSKGFNQIRSENWARNPNLRDFRLRLAQTGVEIKSLEMNTSARSWQAAFSEADLRSLPDDSKEVELQITGMNDFTEIRSLPFKSIPVRRQAWYVEKASQASLFKDGKRKKVVLRTKAGGSCACVTSVVLTPPNGEPVRYEPGNGNDLAVFDDRVELHIETSRYSPGEVTLQVFQAGETEVEPTGLMIYPAPPNDLKLEIRRGESTGRLTGTGLEQVKEVLIDGISAKNVSLSGNGLEFQLGAAQTRESGSFDLLLEGNRKLAEILTPKPELTYSSLLPRLQLKRQSTASYDILPFGLDLRNVPLIPLSADKISVSATHAMSDGYGFDLSLVDRVNIRRSGSPSFASLPKSLFESDDPATLRFEIPMTFTIEGVALSRLLSGGKLEFEIVDKLRGSSGWQRIDATFLRLPSGVSVRCPAEAATECVLVGSDLGLITELSVDNGVTFSPVSILGGSHKLGAIGPENRVLVKVRGYPENIVVIR